MSDDDRTRPWSILARGAGDWEGEETMPPGPGMPDGIGARATHSARLTLGGKGLASEYEQRVDGEVVATAHTLLRWTEEDGGFEMRVFFGGSVEPSVLTGRRDGDRLVFHGEAPHGPMRQTLDYSGGGMAATTDAPDGEGGWTTVFRGSYRKAPPAPGSVGWRDLTVEDAPALRDFYAAVVGWRPQGVSMGDYQDFNMVGAAGEPVAGICHARGGNADLPPVWLCYLVVAELDASLEAVEAGGGSVEGGVRSMGAARWAVIRDPAGAAVALYEAG